MFSCEYCKIFKNSFFTELIWWLLRLIIKLMLLIKLPQRINDRFNVNSKPWKFCFGSFFQWLSYWAVNSLFSTYKSNAKHFFFDSNSKTVHKKLQVLLSKSNLPRRTTRSCPQVFCKKRVLKYFAKITGQDPLKKLESLF